MPYEKGMQLVFDLVERTVVVRFRDEIKMLGPFRDQKTAIRADEEYCREHGWNDRENGSEVVPVT